MCLAHRGVELERSWIAPGWCHPSLEIPFLHAIWVGSGTVFGEKTFSLMSSVQLISVSPESLRPLVLPVALTSIQLGSIVSVDTVGSCAGNSTAQVLV